MFQIALASIAIASVSRAVAMPVEYHPPPAAVPEWARASDALSEPGVLGLEARLLSAQTAASLTVSELRTRALANGSERPESGWPAGKRPPVGRNSERDAQMLATTPSGLHGFEHEAPSEQSVEDAQMDARLQDVRESLTQVALSVANAEVGPDGKIIFSLLGFSTARRGDPTAQMLGDFTAVSAESVGGREGRPTQYMGGPGRASEQDPEARATLLRLLFLAWDTLTHPVVIGLLIFALVFRVLIGLGARRAAF
ncbi:MAG: hypothetical protein KDG55_19275 [Rhodocyclaceae bacterium]|nr:hypothetical protein [Rhodocyclaceae bacterium]